MTRKRDEKGKFVPEPSIEDVRQGVDPEPEYPQTRGSAIQPSSDVPFAGSLAELEAEQVRAPRYGIMAFIAACLAVMAVLATLWGCYYIIRPKLDTAPCVVVSMPPTPQQNPAIAIPEASPSPISSRVLKIAATEDVWMKIIMHTQGLDSTIVEKQFRKDERWDYNLTADVWLEIHAGKPNGLVFSLDGAPLTVRNEAIHSDKIGIYQIDGKELLAQK